MATRIMGIKLLPSIIFITLIASSYHVQANDEALEIVKKTAESVIASVEQDRAALEEDTEKLYQLIDELVADRFDFVVMSKLVLVKHWKTISQEERKEFVKQFRKLLIRAYAKALLSIGVTIEYLSSEELDNNIAVVKTKVVGDNVADFPVQYRMFFRKGTWRVIDVSVDGVSLIATYRNSFSQKINETSMATLLADLAERNNS